MRFWSIPLLIVGVFMTGASLGREDPAEVLERDWHAEAEKAKLSPADIKHLEQEKVLMTKGEYLQCYQAYLADETPSRGSDEPLPDLPFFITTDALFQAYAWCLQKGTAKMETAHAGQMREYVGVLMTSLNQVDALVEGDAAQIRKSKEMAVFVVGVAAVLMDAKVEIKPENLRREVEEEAKRVRKAQGTAWPTRLRTAPNDASSLDYTVFKPVGLYAGDELMEQYCRAVRWLQLAPFRATSDEHMLAAAMLALSGAPPRLQQLRLDKETAELFEGREKRLASLAGPSSAVGVLGCVFHPVVGENAAKNAAEWIQQARETIIRMAVYQREADGVAITSTPRQEVSTEAAAHLIVASTLTDAMLLEKLSQAQGETYFPNALSIASWLGSSYAAEHEKADLRTEGVRGQARRWLDRSVVRRPSLHQEGLMLLQLLVQPPPSDAPAFMKSRAWQAKSCQTVLSAWAQSRHVWALQARPQYSVGAGLQEWPAFVEPTPDFFVGLAGLCRKAGRKMEVLESESVRNQRIARRLRQMADDYRAQANSEERTARDAYVTTVDMLLDAGVKHFRSSFNDEEAITKFTRILRDSAEVIARGEAMGLHPVAQKLRERLAMTQQVPFDDLEDICLRTAVLVHKQARELPPTNEECQWLLEFGAALAIFSDCHFTSPRDNVPKAVRVFTNPEVGKALTVGIGRPRSLYVLYPWKGKEVLCRGAVLPYVERHELESLTDEEWWLKLDDEKAPPIQPGWLKPLVVD